MKIGFTGTRWGVDDNRLKTLKYVVEKLKVSRVGHGMCVGADAQFHKLIRNLNKKVWIKGHPPIEQGKFFSNDLDCDEVAEPKEYLDRDRDIVDEAEVMIATPNENVEQKRSGTWYTIRYAKKVIKSDKGKCKKLYIFLPNGKFKFYDFSKLNK